MSANDAGGPPEELDDYIPGIGRLSVQTMIMRLDLDPGVNDETAREAAEAAVKEIRGSLAVYRDAHHLFTITSEDIS